MQRFVDHQMVEWILIVWVKEVVKGNRLVIEKTNSEF
jgi:hypothetical protein